MKNKNHKQSDRRLHTPVEDEAYRAEAAKALKTPRGGLLVTVIKGIGFRIGAPFVHKPESDE
jgi:hypothetical protein